MAVSRAIGPGEASVAGLRWLASVGPAPLEAWGAAMGWASPTTFSHASRLVRAGWVKSCPTRRGSGSLIYATRTGVAIAGAPASPLAAEPAPTTWAHCAACAWTAAWLTARGRHVVGTRELLVDDSWHTELEWLERGGVRRRGHRPDLAAGIVAGGSLMPIEVELATKSTARLQAILGLHAAWIAARKTSAVIYVCETAKLGARVRDQATQVGLSTERKTLRVELLDTIRDAALAARTRAATPGTKSAAADAGES
jgi:hypothetical protein